MDSLYILSITLTIHYNCRVISQKFESNQRQISRFVYVECESQRHVTT